LKLFPNSCGLCGSSFEEELVEVLVLSVGVVGATIEGVVELPEELLFPLVHELVKQRIIKEIIAIILLFFIFKTPF
jgi:hypothetical protein